MPKRTPATVHPSVDDLDAAILALTQYALPSLEELAAVGRLRGEDLPWFRASLRSLKRYRAARNRAIRNWRKDFPEWRGPNGCSCSTCGYTVVGDAPHVESVCALCYT